MAMVRGILGVVLVLVLLLWGGEAQAGQLADRLAQFPHWESKPVVDMAQKDLVYPDWMEGTWDVTSTLVDLLAPLAPDVVTPGFEGNRGYLNQPMHFQVRFQRVSDPSLKILNSFPLKPLYWPRESMPVGLKLDTVVADRAFNGLNIAKAYLGDRMIQSVKVDPSSPNRQITALSTGRKLISVVTGRASETPTPEQFIATEISNQIFRGISQPYFNQVETTTAYQLEPSPNKAITATQVTAIYLSPQDANYFSAQGRPVALYRYQLELLPLPVDLTTNR